MSIKYLPMKLPEYFAKFGIIRVLILGSGAVGSYEGELLAKLGVRWITFIDMDQYEPDNAAKHSGMIREEDVGRNKAIAAAERAAALMIPEGNANGIDANVTMFGPKAFEGYDAVFVALDNYAAKVYFNQIWLQIPQKRRPLLFMSGTHDELAQINTLDGASTCLRCLFDESWLNNGAVRTSCSGVKYRVENGMREVVRTSNLASCRAALDTVEEFRKYVLGDQNITNKFISFTPGVEPPYTRTTPRPRKSCPDCKDYHPPERVAVLNGSVLDTTLDEAFRMIEDQLGHSKFELMTHVMEFDRSAYAGLITDEYCHHCGKPLSKVYLHEGRVFEEDLLCAACKTLNKAPFRDECRPSGTTRSAVSPDTCDAQLLACSLYRLGWPVGAYLHVRVRGKGDAIDSDDMYYTFTMDADKIWMKKTMKLTKGGYEV